MLAAELPLDQYGFAVFPLYIKPRNSPTMAYTDYKVDTGANCTTISYEWLYTLGYGRDWIEAGKRLEGNTRPTVASGVPLEDCYQIILPEIHLGNWVGYNWPFITSLGVSFRFLLGTDSMSFFNWCFDYDKGICRFDLIPKKRSLLFNQKEQSIHSIGDSKKIGRASCRERV